jgi:hypothetical protein
MFRYSYFQQRGLVDSSELQAWLASSARLVDASEVVSESSGFMLLTSPVDFMDLPLDKVVCKYSSPRSNLELLLLVGPHSSSSRKR